MARFNAELDDGLHLRFVEYARARGVPMRQILKEFLEGLLSAPTPDAVPTVAAIEIHLGVGVHARLDREGQRVHVRVTGQWSREEAGDE